MKNKKITTASRLQSRSELAITAFRSLIDNLKTANEEAEAAKLANETQIAALEAENSQIAALAEKNSKIIQNVENLLTT